MFEKKWASSHSTSKLHFTCIGSSEGNFGPKCSQSFLGTPFAMRNVIPRRRCKSRTQHNQTSGDHRRNLPPNQRPNASPGSINHHHQLHSQCRRLRTKGRRKEERTAAKDIHNNRDITRRRRRRVSSKSPPPLLHSLHTTRGGGGRCVKPPFFAGIKAQMWLTSGPTTATRQWVILILLAVL